MRLSLQEVTAIKNGVHEFDPEAIIYLFGSRVRDELKGGDIDLLVMSSKIGLEEIIKLKLKLFDTIGEQKIDIIVPDETNEAFVQLILSQGVLL